jgi:hypothetical protein
MSATYEPPSVQRDVESRSPDRESAAPVAQQPYGPWSDFQHTDALGSPILRHPANSVLRTTLMRRTQHQLGNRAAQQMVAQLRRSSLVQRSCACGGTCEECKAAMPAPAEEDELQIQRSSSNAAGTNVAPEQRGLEDVLEESRGEPIEDRTREQMESRFGHDFRDVRVHTGEHAAAASSALQADAFTTGRDIYFAAGQYDTSSQDGQHLLAHELTHTVQQSEGSVSEEAASLSPSGLRVSEPGDPLEQEAERTADVVTSPHTEQTAAPTAHTAQATVQRQEKKSLTERAEDTLKEGIEWAIRKAVPEMAELIVEGPAAFIRKSISTVIQDWIPGFFSKIDIGSGIASLKTWFAGVIATIKGAFTGDSKTCEAFAQMMAGLKDFANKVLESEAIDKAKKAMVAVNDAVGYIYKLVLAPQFDALKEILGGAWTVIRKIGDTVSGWIAKAKSAVSGAWDWISTKLGLNSDNPDGVWAWIKGKATSVWTSIKETLAPAAEPLSSVAKTLSLLTPMGQIGQLVEQGPKVVKAVKWLWEHRSDKNLIANAHEQMKDTFLPQLLDAGNSIEGATDKAFNWIIDKVTSVGGAVLSFVGSLTGVPLLSMAKGFFETVKTKASEFATWAEEGLKSAVKKVKDLVKGLGDFIAPYKEILSSVTMAILNPPMIPLIIAGWIWRKLDTCIKRPIIEFFFDIIVKALEKAPDLPFLGPLWAMFKAGALGFLKKLSGAPYAIKEKICDKIAKILSGASPDFMFGFVKGFLEGIWDGITDPFKAIWTVLEGLHWVQDFFTNLMASALGIPRAGKAAVVQEQRPAAPASTGAPSQAAPVNKAAAPLATATVAAPTVESPTGGPASQQLSPELQAELGNRAGAMLSEVGPDIETVRGGFWDAAKEYFSGSGSVSFDDLTKKLGEAWHKMLASLQSAGADLGAKFIDWFTKDTAEEDLGDKLGWLAGSVLFQIALDYISGGTWLAAYPILTTIAKFLNWPVEALGVVFKALAKLGKYVVDGVKSLGSMIKEAAAGALKAVSEAIGRIGEKLVLYAEEIVGKFAGGAAKEASSLAEHEAGSLVGKESAKVAEGEAKQLTEKELAEQAEKKAGEKAGEKTEQQSAENAAQHAAEEGEAIVAAEAVEVAAEAARRPLWQAIAALELSIMPRFKWVTGFESKSEGAADMIYMLGSRIPLLPYPKDVRLYRELDPAAAHPDLLGDKRLVVDMPFVGKGAPATNAAGWARDAELYWTQMLERHPEAFSPSNRWKIANGLSPVNDPAFRSVFTQYDKKAFFNDPLIHHHIGGGGQAFAVPATLHPGSGGIHNLEKDAGIWGKEDPVADMLDRLKTKTPATP